MGDNEIKTFAEKEELLKLLMEKYLDPVNIKIEQLQKEIREIEQDRKALRAVGWGILSLIIVQLVLMLLRIIH
jgi:AcrR family transcriptional regulator